MAVMKKTGRKVRRKTREFSGKPYARQRVMLAGTLCVIICIYIFISIIDKEVGEGSRENRSREDGKIQEALQRDTIEGENTEEISNEKTGGIAEETSKEKTGEITDRTEEETDSAPLQKVLPEANESLFTEEEKRRLEEMALEAAEEAGKVYRDIELEEGPSFASNIKEFTQAMRTETVSLLGQAGYTSITEGCNMENPEKVEAFYKAYQEKLDAGFTVFDVNEDGLISVKNFLYREGRLQVYYIGIGWQEGGVPGVRDTSLSDLAEINLTEKGYFIYQYENNMPHSSLRLYWRVKPLPDVYRELTEKYIAGLSYVNYNMLVTNWDGGSVEDILMPCMFEDIYRMAAGENLTPENGMIPAEVYEKIMTTYFPVSAEQLRRCCGYEKESNAYRYEMILGRQYPPFGEVTGYTENADGTVTLTVDGVWPDYNSDCAFVNTIVLKPFGDGTFRYLSNSVEEKELELPTAGMRKDYDIPVSEEERKEAEYDCCRMMELVSDIYKQADREELSGVVLSDEMVFLMQDNLKKTGVPVTTAVLYSDMENYREADRFLRECEQGKYGSLAIYKIRYDGGIGRSKFIFDGRDMYILTASGVWSGEDKPGISNISCAKITEWEYTKRGWFGYKMCVPEYPEVTEIVDGSCLVRIKPMTKRQRELSGRCVRIPGYRGNNLLSSDWDAEHMEKLDYNGLYEYLYEMENQEAFPEEAYREGIPKEEFESLIMAYLPVSAEQLRKYAAFDPEKQVYPWIPVRGGSYVLSFFETSLPEVAEIKENGDGTLTLTVCAVCDTVICNDALITCELTVRFEQDGSFGYLGNRILDGGERNIPAYQYRISSV